MPLNVGIGTIPTPGDVLNTVEATLGNVVEGVIEGVTGAQVELTPGNGVDNTTVSSPDGRSGNVKFDKKFASHEDVEKLRKELEKKLGEANRERTRNKLELARLKARLESNLDYSPGGLVPPSTGGIDPLMLVLLTEAGGGGGLASNPLLLVMLMQNMSNMQVGRVGPGGAFSVDMSQVLMLQLVVNSMTRATSRSAPAASASTAGGTN